MIMQKIGKNSHFDVIRGDDLKGYKDRILQIDTVKQYINGKYGVYLCEIDDRVGVRGQDEHTMRKL